MGVEPLLPSAHRTPHGLAAAARTSSLEPRFSSTALDSPTCKPENAQERQGGHSPGGVRWLHALPVERRPMLAFDGGMLVQR
jgi:hypothetical protein